MKRLILIASLLAVIILLLPSCAAFYQRGYMANAPNLNCFERDNEKNLKLSLFLNHFEVQSNYALAKHWGMSACVNGGFRGQYGGELAGIYYKRFNDKSYFETQLGYGYNKNQTEVDAAWSFMAGETGTWYYRNTDIRYHKIFVQPTYAMVDQKKTIILGLKISANYFDKYHYRCSITDQEDYKNSSAIVQSDFRHRWNMTFEPGLKILFNHFFYLQFSGLISTSADDTPKMYVVRSHEGGLISSDVLGKVGNPQHLGFLATIGFEIKMGKKKDKKE